MDLLSRLLSLMPVSGRLEIRCHFGAPWAIEEETAGMREIPYHVLLSGTPSASGPAISCCFPPVARIAFMTAAACRRSLPSNGGTNRC
jgi:hypothetical protein